MPTTAISSRYRLQSVRRRSIQPAASRGAPTYIDDPFAPSRRASPELRDRRRADRQFEYHGLGIPGFTFESNAISHGRRTFPDGFGTFDEGDLVTFSIGGNDARFYQQNGGTFAGAPTAATISAATAAAGIDALVGAGAQNISFLAGNTSMLPEIANDPTAQAIRNSYSTTFNRGDAGCPGRLCRQWRHGPLSRPDIDRAADRRQSRRLRLHQHRRVHACAVVRDRQQLCQPVRCSTWMRST